MVGVKARLRNVTKLTERGSDIETLVEDSTILSLSGLSVSIHPNLIRDL